MESTHEIAGKIRLLPENLVNQIAAGEVVERPASLVKELVENSLDAGASQIDVYITDGGRGTISVLDNGTGMNERDLFLSVDRHATSKITSLEDLESIGTFGFRGEALSSIASVAQVTIQSRTEDSDRAHVLEIKYGNKSWQKPKGGAVGTQITVENLFEKIPARLKFLRTAGTEFSYCARAVKEVALGNPDVSFSLHHQGKRVHQFRSQSMQNRVWDCQKYPWKPEEGLSFHAENEGIALQAYLSPTHQISDKGEVMVYLNKRPIRHRLVQSAIRNAYADTLGPHHVPSGTVFLSMRSDWIDVNVHPQKLEVRIFKSERLYPWLVATLRKEISQVRSTRQLQSPVRIETPRTVEFISNRAHLEPKWEPRKSTDVFTLPMQPTGTLTGIQKGIVHEEQPLFTAHSEVEQKKSNSIKYLGQIKASYLVCEANDGLFLIDQHALHEKMVFESLVQQHRNGPLEVQKQLIPLVVGLSVDEMAIAEKHKPTLSKIGLEYEVIGDSELALHSRPALLRESQTESVFRAILRALQEPGVTASELLDRELRSVFATIACHTVVRANQALGATEVAPLLEGLFGLNEGWTCPHGRPVLFRLPYPIIEKHFER